MSLIIEGEGLLTQSLSLLRECGAYTAECVVVWLGPIAAARVTRVVHPKHTSEHGGYQVDGEWVGALYEELAERGERVVAQVHTHPRQAFHSRRDDAYPVVLEAGLYSLVIPNYASEPIDQAAWYLTQLQGDGTWREVNWRDVVVE